MQQAAEEDKILLKRYLILKLKVNFFFHYFQKISLLSCGIVR